MIWKVLSLFCLFACSALGFYAGDKEVVELDSQTFQKRVIEGDEIWIIKFYATWCGHCQAMVTEYKKMAHALRNLSNTVKVGAVNAIENERLASQNNIRSFPTMKIYGIDKKNPRDYTGSRTAEHMIDELFRELRSSIDIHLTGTTRKPKMENARGAKEDSYNDGKVVELTDDNFKKTVLESKDMWLVEFYAPWCGHCQRLQPQWAKAASSLNGKVKLGAIDSTLHTLTASRYQIKGYPTIKYFAQGDKDGSTEDFNGGRTSEDIVAWALDRYQEFIPAPEVKEIIGEKGFREACEEHPVCAISILPNILDCQSACRNDYIEVLQKVSDRYKKNQWSWIWAEAQAQPELEEALGFGGFGYPAMALLSAKKYKYSVLRGSFSYEGISDFVRGVTVGRGTSVALKNSELPAIVTTDPWDGKDKEMPTEEDIDLSDVDLSDMSDLFPQSDDKEPANQKTEL